MTDDELNSGVTAADEGRGIADQDQTAVAEYFLSDRYGSFVEYDTGIGGTADLIQRCGHPPPWGIP